MVFAIVSSLTAFGQTDEGLFLDLNFGGRFSGAFSDSVSMSPGLHIEGATGYMFSNIVGIRGVLSFDSFKTSDLNASPEIIDRSYMLRATLEAVLSISELAGFGTDEFDLNFHSGLGIATQSNPSWKESREEAQIEFNDPFLKGNDDMINVTMGLNPKYHISDNLSINADITYVILSQKDWTADRFNNVSVNGVDGILNGSVGLSYNF